MKIKWKKDKDNEWIDITDFISTVTWSGSVSQASRALEVAVLYSPFDRNISNINIDIGDRLRLYDDNNRLLINIMVYTRERVSEQGTITYSGYDDLNRLLNSNWSYKFKDTTPEKITKMICNNMNVDIGKIDNPNVNIRKLLIDGESYYNIIMKAYKKAFLVTGKKYMPFMYDTKLHVIEKGNLIKGFYLCDDVNITASNYSESIESIINSIRIYNDKGKQIGVTSDDTSIEKYGIFQDVYTKEEGVNASNATKNMLHGIDKEASIDALGNVNCISGYSVGIKDSLSGLKGKFLIENDTHTWESGNYTMSLDLVFKNIINPKEDEE